MKFRLLYLLIAILASATTHAQFSLSGEFRPRGEFRNGFSNIIPDAASPGFGISTRARLNFGYKHEGYDLYISLQDVLVWGENRQILPYDQNNSFAVFEAWAKIKLAEGFHLKGGRQVLSYDDQRILGGLDWAQQGRNHDLALFQYKKDSFALDFGLAWNQDYSHPTGFNSIGNEYTTTGYFSYKTMQMVHASKKWDKFSGSLLFMSNGFQGEGNPVSYLFTTGTHLKYKSGAFGAAANAYLQTGERAGELKVDGAYLLGLDLSYKTSDKVSFGLGAELISGDDTSTTDATEAFFPLYGTNHKFNGFMDYFYVGNHTNDNGLLDIHASAKFKLGEKSGLMMKILNFSGAEDLASGENALGTELDLVYSTKLKGYGLKVGYSHMFASDGMYELKEITKDAADSMQNWAWVMFIFKPKFL